MNKNFYLYAMFLVLFITAAYCIFSFSNVDLLGGFRSSDIDIGDGFSPIVEGNYEHKGTKSNPLSLYEDNDIIAFDGENHNTVTPIARVVDGKFQLDLVLRNNRTSKEFEDGIFHPHKDIHHIKKENIGLIEVMGLAVLPGRLKNELAEIKDVLLNNLDVPENLSLHKEWIEFLKTKYETFEENTIEELLKQEVAIKFNRCLIDAGVYKETEKGFEGFKKFVNSL